MTTKYDTNNLTNNCKIDMIQIIHNLKKQLG